MASGDDCCVVPIAFASVIPNSEAIVRPQPWVTATLGLLVELSMDCDLIWSTDALWPCSAPEPQPAAHGNPISFIARNPVVFIGSGNVS